MEDRDSWEYEHLLLSVLKQQPKKNSLPTKAQLSSAQLSSDQICSRLHVGGGRKKTSNLSTPVGVQVALLQFHQELQDTNSLPSRSGRPSLAVTKNNQ